MFRRLGQYVCGFLGLSTSGREPLNPEGLLAGYQAALRAQLAHYNQSLAASARFCELLKEQIRDLEQRENACRAALQAQMQRGGPASLGGELALSLHAASDELAGLREQLREAEATCEHIHGARDAAIEAARQKMEELQGILSEQQVRQAITGAIEGARTPE